MESGLNQKLSAPASSLSDDTGVGPASRRRFSAFGSSLLTVVVVLSLVFGGVAFNHHLTRTVKKARVSASGATSTTGIQAAPPPSYPLPSVPPAAGSSFPFPTFGPQDGVSANDVLHHSGGPYIGNGAAQDVALRALGCDVGGSQNSAPSGVETTCNRADIAFFDKYADAWALRGANWQFIASWGADREIYVVTIWGTLYRFSTAVNLPGGFVTNEVTFEIDATTGKIMLVGGYPLPASDATIAHG